MRRKLTPEMFLLALLVAFGLPGLAITAAMGPGQDNAELQTQFEDSLSTRRLVVFETASCGYCRRFRRTIAPAYANSNYQALAPLTYVRPGSHESQVFKLQKGIWSVPTFVLVDVNRREIARMQGLPSQDEFYRFLDRNL